MFARPLFRASLLAVGIVVAAVAKPLNPAGVAGFVAAPPSAAKAAAEIGDDVPLGPAHYNSTPTPLPPNLHNLDFESSATAEFGDLVQLGGTAHYIDTATVTLSSGAMRSDYPGAPQYGFAHPITLRLYAVDRSTGEPRPGALIANVTRNVLIPWRPEQDPTTSSPQRPFKAADGRYYAGLAFTVGFDLGELAAPLPGEFIYSISFPTEHAGNRPLGTPGPYNALALAFTEQPPNPGVDPEPDAVFWKTAAAANYADLGARGANVFRRDTGWTPYRPAVRFTNSAYGAVADAAATVRALQSADRALKIALGDAATLLSFALPRGYWSGHNRLQLDEGEIVFGAMADAAVSLTLVARSSDPAAAQAQRALETLQRAAQMLAESTLGDAILSAGSMPRIMRAQDALDEAYARQNGTDAAAAIDSYGHAWREAHDALP